MFDRGQAPSLTCEEIAGWTAEDDAMVATLTEAARAEGGRPSTGDAAGSTELPIELLAALLSGPETSPGADLVAAMQAHARMVAYHRRSCWSR